MCEWCLKPFGTISCDGRARLARRYSSCQCHSAAAARARRRGGGTRAGVLVLVTPGPRAVMARWRVPAAA